MADLERLDHTVINVQFDMDRAEGLFRDLGFTLTPRGFHSMGSMNHLMMFGTDYLELIGLPRDMENPRRDIADAPLGVNGLVFKSPDINATFAHMQALGLDGDPPKSFTRPVDLPDGPQDAAFSTVAVRTGVFPGGRVYYCQHDTPQLVWRPEWQSHANGAVAMPEFVVASTEHEREAADFARLLHSDVAGSGDTLAVAYRGGQLTVMTPEAYGARYGDLASPMAGRNSIFGAIVFRTDSLDKVRGVAAGLANPVPLADGGDRVVLRQPEFDSVLEFVA